MKELRFYAQLFQMLGYFPRKLSYYRLAFLPRSASAGHENGSPINNERLEYLGDAILGAIVAEYLFNMFPEAGEGLLTQLRARIVKRKNLDQLAVKMNIPAMIVPGAARVSNSKHVFGNALEALIGAVYLDRGYGTARRFFERKIIRKHIDLVKLFNKDPDYKSRIIEWAQKNRIEVLFESHEEQFSSANYPIFSSTVSLNGEAKGTGRGESKKEAEQQAAGEALSFIQPV